MSIDLTNSKNVIVSESSIHGFGVFAKRAIPAGEVVLRWENTREINETEYKDLSDYERNYIEIRDGKIFLVGPPERFVNHSCDANTKPGHFCDIASRDIAAGEEITADYGQFHIPSGQIQCACGSPSCRKVITGV